LGAKCVVRFSEAIEKTLWFEINLRENGEIWVGGGECGLIRFFGLPVRRRRGDAFFY